MEKGLETCWVERKLQNDRPVIRWREPRFSLEMVLLRLSETAQRFRSSLGSFSLPACLPVQGQQKTWWPAWGFEKYLQYRHPPLSCVLGVCCLGCQRSFWPFTLGFVASRPSQMRGTWLTNLRLKDAFRAQLASQATRSFWWLGRHVVIRRKRNSGVLVT